MRLIISIACLFLGITSAHAQPAGTRQTDTPIELFIACKADPEFCAARDVRTISATPENLKTIRWINSYINRTIQPAHDATMRWKYFPSAGDCNDYAYTKAKLLQKLFPAGALSLAIVWSGRQWHLINVIRTTAGEIALDNQSNTPARLSDYRIIKIMDYSNPKIWREPISGEGGHVSSN